MPAYRLAVAAEADIRDLLAYSQSRFGTLARERYERLLISGLRDLATDPMRAGSLARPELGKKVRSYHLRHSRDRARHEHGIVVRPRHLILYRLATADLIDIGRVLHDAMEMERHLPADYSVGE